MNKGELVSAVAGRAGLSRGDATRVIDTTFEVITDALRDGQGVKLVGFGTFQVAEREAGEARNPKTGERVEVPATRAAKFRAGTQLKNAMNPDR